MSPVAWAEDNPSLVNRVDGSPSIQTEDNSRKQVRLVDVLDVDNQNIVDTLQAIALKTGLTIFADNDVNGKVSMSVRNVNVWDLLRVILDSNKLAYREEDGVIHVMSAEGYRQLTNKDFNDDLKTATFILRYAQLNQVRDIVGAMVSPAGSFFDSEMANNIYVIDTADKIKAISDVVAKLDVKVKTKSFELKIAKPEDIIKIIKPLLTDVIGDIEQKEKTLTVTDTPEKIQEIEEVIDKNDRLEREILFDVKAIQIALNDEHQKGVDWEAILSDYQRLPPGKDPALLSFGSVSEEDFAVLLDALDTVGVISTIGDMKVTTEFNKPTDIEVKSLDLRDTMNQSGSKIPLKREGDITMVAKFDPATGFSLDLQPALRQLNLGDAKITVKVQESYTVVVGGFMRDVTVDSLKKIPFLGDLPLVGFAFRNEGQKIRKTEVILFLTPKILVNE